ncbi:MAG: type I glyceraldehyde-3-phosphate dehydrogenase [Candidatus Andersenbacteria bacterium]
MATRLAINGFGRIGRAAFKIALEQDEVVEVVAINDLGEPENLAYLLRYDTIYGRYSKDIAVNQDKLVVGGKEIKVFAEKDPKALPWGDLKIDVVIEATGVFTDRESATAHLVAGAKKVIISAPTKDNDVATVVLGVNDKDLQGQTIISNASCTTNCITPVAAVIESAFGIEKALLTTAHAYTATQALVDSPGKKDFRGGRAGAANMVPASTGAAVAATQALPSLEGKFDGIAVRVPLPIVSLSDFTFLLKREVTVDEVNQVLTEAVDNPLYRGVLAVTKEPVVSSDFIGDPHSAIVDLQMTRVVGGNLVKVLAWYDNEWGYSNRLVEQVIELGK